MKPQEDNSLESVFRSTLSGGKLMPSAKVWSGVEAQLETRRRRKRVLAWWYRSAASVVLLAGMTAWFLWQGIQPSAPPDAQFAWQSPPVSAPRVSVPRADVPAAPAAATRTQFPTLKYADVSASHPVYLETVHQLPVDVGAMAGAVAVRPLEYSGISLEADTDAKLTSRKRPEKIIRMELADSYGSKKRRFYAGASYSPDFALQGSTDPGTALTSAAKTNFSGSDANMERATSNLQPVLASSFTTGMRFGYNINRRISLQSGVLYSNQRGMNQDVESYQVNDQATGQASVNTEVSWQTMELPLAVRMNMRPGKRLNYYFTGGVSSNLFLRFASTSDAAVPSLRQSTELDSRSIIPAQFNLTAGTGVEYIFHDKVSLSLEPTLRYGVVTTQYSLSATKRAATIGAFGGVNYLF